MKKKQYMNRIEIIIDNILRHEISKYEAIQQLQKIFDEQRKFGALQFYVEEVAFGSESNDGLIKARIPYGYSHIEGKIRKGSKIDVSLIY